MKKVFIFGALIFSLSANFVFAQTPFLMPFGGRILIAPMPGIVCPAGKLGSPFFMTPLLPAPPGPFIGDYNVVSNNFMLAPGAAILGLYIPIPIPECATTSAPPAPVPGFRTFIHGTNRKFTP